MHAADPAVDTVQRDVVGFSSEHTAASIGHPDLGTVELMTLGLTFEWFCKAEQRMRCRSERAQHVKQQHIANQLGVECRPNCRRTIS